MKYYEVDINGTYAAAFPATREPANEEELISYLKHNCPYPTEKSFLANQTAENIQYHGWYDPTPTPDLFADRDEWPVFGEKSGHLYEINLICPNCGSWQWESTESDLCICTECGSEYTPDQMEVHYYEVEE